MGKSGSGKYWKIKEPTVKKIKFKGTTAYQIGKGKKAVIFIPKFWKRKDYY